jgi:5-methyltetrahydropteroyltriglutamate--homocysteine methyltransferase
MDLRNCSATPSTLPFSIKNGLAWTLLPTAKRAWTATWIAITRSSTGFGPSCGPQSGPWGYDQQTRYEAIGKIQAPTGLGILQEFTYLRDHTHKPTKVTCAGPLTFGSRIRPNNVYKNTVEIAEEFAHVINAELQALVEAGATFIQLDEPARGNVSGAEMARLFNLARKGLRRSWRSTSVWQPLWAHPLQAQLQRLLWGPSAYRPFVLEYASREMARSKWKEWHDGRELGAGIIDVKSFHPESPEDVAERLRTVLRYASPEKVYINPDCGFGWSPRNMAVGKLQAMVAGTAIVRQELTSG